MNSLINVVSGEALLRSANAGVAVLIARQYGATALGTYATILAVSTVAERLADNGLELTGIAEVSAPSRDRNEIVAALLVSKTALSAVAMGLLALLAWSTGLPAGHWTIAAILALRTFLYSYCRLHAGFLKATEQTKVLVGLQSLHFVVLVICLTAVYLRGQSLVVLLLCLLAAQFLEYTMSCGVLHRLGFRLSGVSLSLCWKLLHHSTPIGMIYLLNTVMLRGDVVVLSLVASAYVVGTFAAANTGLVMIYVVAFLFSGILLSDLGRLSAHPSEFDAHFRRCLRWVLLLCIPLAGLCALFAPVVIRLLFGISFTAAGLPGAFMMLALPFILLNAAFLSRAIARKGTWLALRIFGFGAALSLALNFVLGRQYGALGVAGAIVMRESAMTLTFALSRNFPARRNESVAPEETGAGLPALLNT